MDFLLIDSIGSDEDVEMILIDYFPVERIISTRFYSRINSNMFRGADFYIEFCFKIVDFHLLCVGLEILENFKTKIRYNIEGNMGLLIVLHNLSYPKRFRDTKKMFKRSKSY